MDTHTKKISLNRGSKLRVRPCTTPLHSGGSRNLKVGGPLVEKGVGAVANMH